MTLVFFSQQWNICLYGILIYKYSIDMRTGAAPQIRSSRTGQSQKYSFSDLFNRNAYKNLLTGAIKQPANHGAAVQYKKLNKPQIRVGDWRVWQIWSYSAVAIYYIYFGFNMLYSLGCFVPQHTCKVLLC